MKLYRALGSKRLGRHLQVINDASAAVIPTESWLAPTEARRPIAADHMTSLPQPEGFIELINGDIACIKRV
jgi:hypothetical protein